MKYRILESHITFLEEKLTEVAVLWKDGSSVRATYCSLHFKAGHQNLTLNDTLSPELLQKVAGGGSYLNDEQKKKCFPGKRNWSK